MRWERRHRRSHRRHVLTGLAEAIQAGPAAHLMTALIDAAARDPAFAAVHHAEATARHGVVLTVIRRGITRGELPKGTEPGDVLDLVAGPILYRHWMTGKKVTRGFVTRVVNVTLTGLTHT